MNMLKQMSLFTLSFVVVLMPLFAIPTPIAHAATTTTKYLNGKILVSAEETVGSGVYDIFAVSLNGTRTNLTNAAGINYEAMWSPDNTKIAFLSSRDNPSSREIYVMDADGSSQTRLTNNSVTESSVSWSPDGSKILFVSTQHGNFEIYTVAIDNSSQTRLTNNSSAEFNPEWSPDGSKIAFSTNRDINFEIYTMDIDGSNPLRVTNNPSGDNDPRWSPDGTKLSFVRTSKNLYTISPDGSGETQIISSADNLSSPSWSPDSTKIIYMHPTSGESEDLYAAVVSDPVEIRLTNTAAYEEESPGWSPDGAKIAYTAYPNDFSSSEVYTMDADGNNQTALTNYGSYGSIAYYDPTAAWQPLPYAQTQNDDGTTTSTIPSSANYSSTEYTVTNNETLVLDGVLCDVTIQSGGTLIGTGSIAPGCSLTIEPGGTLAPGHSPGCLASGDTTIAGTYQAEIASATACTGYDQLQVTGTVTLTPTSSLTASLLNNFTPAPGTSFTIITNDGTDPVTGTFAGLPEGSTITIGNTILKISYLGGTGNDITLTALAIPGVPATGWGRETVNIAILLSSSILLIGVVLGLLKRYQPKP